MDYLPSVMSSVCKNVEQIIVETNTGCYTKTYSISKKIGAGLDLRSF